MTQFVDGDEIDLDLLVSSVVTPLARKYAGYVDREDLVQECWLWWCTPDGAARRAIEGQIAGGETRKAAWKIQREMWKKCETYARRGKAASSGYSTADEHFYTTAAITMALPAVLMGDAEIGPISEGSTTKRKPGEIVARTDPAEGGSWIAIYADVAKAWNEADLSEKEAVTLALLHRDQRTQDEVADLLGVNQATVSRTAQRGLRKLSDALGGASPWDREDKVDEALRRRPGTRSGWSGMEQEVME